MYKVEYLLLVDGSKAPCRTSESLKHLLQADSDIVITEDGKEIIYKDNLRADLEIVRGDAATDDDDTPQAVYFDIQLICRSKKDLQTFSSLLRAIRKITTPILISPSALQVLWDDLSAHYAGQAYPIISATENRMRKLITKFMHINVGVTWIEERIPDDVQKSINSSNSDSTYLYNVDFIKLKDILLSESYNKHRDALVKELKTSQKATFKKDEIKALIPTSNWERYFSSQVGSDRNELASLWDKLYDLRCKVAHNKSFTLSDLTETKELTKKVNTILDDAISKLDDVHVDKDEAQDIVDEVVATTSNEDMQRYTKVILSETRRLHELIYSLSTPLQPEKEKPRKLHTDLGKLLAVGYINEERYQLIRRLLRLRNRLVHNIDNHQATVSEFETNIKLFKDINARLDTILDSINRNSPSREQPGP